MIHADYTRLFEQKTWHLSLERESDKFWIVCDGDAVMIRTPSCDTAIAFMRAFCEKTPGASMSASADAVIEHSWRVAQDSNVLQFRRRPLEPIDEEAGRA